MTRPGATGFVAAFGAVYAGQLSRARTARASLFFVATLQSLGLVLLLRGVVDDGRLAEKQHIVAGSVVLVIAFVALNLLAQRFGLLRATGALDYYAALPVPSAAVVLGIAASYASFAVPGTVIVAVAGALLYGLPLAQLWVLAPVVVVGGAALAGVGAALGLAAPRPELATVFGQLGMTLVLFLGLIRAARMPRPLRAVRALVPSTYAVDALAEAFAAEPSYAAILRDLAICAGAAGLALTLAAAAYRGAVSR